MVLPQGRRGAGGHSSAVSPLAGLFNLRGDDIPYNPVFYSYTLLTATNIRWAVGAVGLSPNPPPLSPYTPPASTCSQHTHHIPQRPPIAPLLQVPHLSQNQPPRPSQ